MISIARKNNSQQTIENILTVSAGLFNQKGYDKTSMQDIVEALGMSKGAIFHHFRSKEDIFSAVIDRHSAYASHALAQALAEMEGRTAKEKLTGLLERNAQDKQLHALDHTFASRIQSPHFIAAYMQDCVKVRAPIFARLMREGQEDGSIRTDFPDECAEVFFLLVNIWCDHAIFPCDLPRLTRRLKYLQQLMGQMGVDIVSDEMITEYVQSLERLYQKGNES